MTTAAELTLIDESEAERVIRWRFEELVRAGYGLDSALEIAVHGEVDLHLAVDLAHRGCPPETARRILL
jgi:hypothetical protein